MKVIGLAGWSGAGKTTLLARIIPHFLKEGLRGSVIKHAHHGFDVDVPGKDSWVHRQSGAPAKMSRVDLCGVGGFKPEPHRKIEVHRAANGKPLLFPDDPAISGIASDGAVETALPVAHLADITALA